MLGENADSFFLSRKELLGLFVVGSRLGILNEPYSNTIGLVNGADVVTEQLFFKESEGHIVKALAKLNGFQIVNLKKNRPLGMIVSLPNADRHFFEFGVSNDRFSFPVLTKATAEELKWRKKTIIYRKLAVDYAAAITTYKVQGATLTNGILDLNNPSSRLKPLTIQDVYVAISRFTSMSDFKICPLVNAKDKL